LIIVVIFHKNEMRDEERTTCTFPPLQNKWRWTIDLFTVHNIRRR